MKDECPVRISVKQPYRINDLLMTAVLTFIYVAVLPFPKMPLVPAQPLSPLAQSNTSQTVVIPDIATDAVAKATTECHLSDTFTPEVQRWETEICRWSREHELDPNLIATIMQIESCGNNSAVSVTGVRGLFQVTGANLDGQNPFDPNVSMAKGPGKVLKNQLASTAGNVKAAMAGYNGGGKAKEYISGRITRTQLYWYLRRHPSGYWRTDKKALAKINEIERYAQWANIYYESGEGKKETLGVWWNLGGYRLCESAKQAVFPSSDSS